MNFEWQYDEPDMHIKNGNKIKGNMKFDGFLRIDGTVEGKLITTEHSKILISNTGSYTGNLSISAALINGHMIGNLSVEDLHLGSNAILYGDVTCKSIKVEYGASIVGQLSVSIKFILNQDLDTKSLIEDSNINDNLQKLKIASIDEESQSTENDYGFYRKPPKKAYRNILLIVEPQVDFYPGGTIYSTESPQHHDETESNSSTTNQIAEFISKNIENITDIVILLDSHNHIHIASSGFWVNKSNHSPAIDTLITIKDVQDGTWLPKKEESLDYCIAILQQLEESKQLYGHRENNSRSAKVGITINPEHCMLGSFGSSIVPVINEAIDSWVSCTLRNPTYIVREINHVGGGYMHKHKPFATHTEDCKNSFFTGAGADDIIEQMITTNNSIEENSHKSFYDLSFLEELKKEDKLYVCGQLGSHCVEFNITDIINSIALSSSEICSENIFILKDTIKSTKNLVISSEQLASKQEVISDEYEKSVWNALDSSGINIVRSSEILL